MIWKKPVDIALLNTPQDYMGSYLGITFTGFTDNSLTAAMPVTPKVHQPYGILHGGASVVLAETVGSYASSLVVDTDQFMVVGLEVNANHLKPVASGTVHATCTPLHLGSKTHVWDIRIYNDEQQLTCISRLTVVIIEKRTFK
ncbi:hotdog fold thioesterase [Niabella beijingensis]|uniref:hotdog fold thioesterase n=1 Tax=Niabella beijingensis TaxID=2872700 RepID=UPI001CBC6774|nr:hotdog fold thioesterase [Niabella beijingensis]MBZ4187275.1 hotdog fold thioesterase [Niabella beijingensis]